VLIEREPGVGWKYSGGGYTLAQLLLEETTGRSFAEFLRAEVLEPLGMKSSAYGWTDEVLALSATPYDEDGNPLPRGGPCFAELAAAGLQTTPADLGRFAAACLARFRPAGAPAVLTAETLELMQSPAPSSPEYGLGFEVLERDGLRLVGHGGANDGWMARLALVPATGDGIVILTNGSNGNDVIRILERIWIASLSSAPAAAARPR
jgi:CubicO group peptidase (beta-lactamase class C family)